MVESMKKKTAKKKTAPKKSAPKKKNPAQRAQKIKPVGADVNRSTAPKDDDYYDSPFSTVNEKDRCPCPEDSDYLATEFD